VFGPAVFDRDVLALDITALLQSLAECAHRPGEPLKRLEVQKPDHRHGRLLRPRGDRPGGRTTKQRDEVAPLHSITSAAVESSVGGTVRPSILAVPALMTNSNLLDCTTGRSAGLLPLRMRLA